MIPPIGRAIHPRNGVDCKGWFSDTVAAVRWAAQNDRSQAPIVKALRAAGCFVEPRMSRVGQGVPDLLVGRAGVWYVLECKAAKGKTHNQKSTIAKQLGWRAAAKVAGGCEVFVVTTPESALAAVGVKIAP